MRNVSGSINRKSILKIIAVSLLFKVAFLLFYYFVMYNGLDTFDIKYYYMNGQNLLSGHMPYIDFGFDYPPLIFIPILVSIFVTHNLAEFMNIFSAFMILCDLVTALCVYLIALDIFNDDKLAFRAALVYSTALAIAYYTFTKFDPMPTMFLMLAVLFTIRGDKLSGYYSLLAGVFSKIFPIILSPFFFLYNVHCNDGSIYQEFKSIFLRVIVPTAALLAIAVAILVALPKETMGSWARGLVYVNTPGYTIYAFLSEVLGFKLSMNSIVTGETALLCLIFLVLMVYAYLKPQTHKQFLKILLVALFSFVALWSYHSPQYMFWYTPILAILIADDLLSVLLFYIIQLLEFIEFPVTSGVFYTNTYYVTTLAKDPHLWWLTWTLFAAHYFALIYIMYRVVSAPMGKSDGRVV